MTRQQIRQAAGGPRASPSVLKPLLIPRPPERTPDFIMADFFVLTAIADVPPTHDSASRACVLWWKRPLSVYQRRKRDLQGFYDSTLRGTSRIRR